MKSGLRFDRSDMRSDSV